MAGAASKTHASPRRRAPRARVGARVELQLHAAIFAALALQCA
jgi:hypothetical protein